MSVPAIQAPTAPPVWVNRPELFKRMVGDLSRHWVIAIDTESNSLFAYREQVCLIQISTGETDYLVDPLALSDLSALAPIFADPQIEKVFHAAEYDVICLKRDFGFTFVQPVRYHGRQPRCGPQRGGIGGMFARGVWGGCG